MQPLVLVHEEEPGIAQITLNRPEKRNALNVDLLSDFLEALAAVHSDSSIRAVLICGAGPTFCAGMDLHEAAIPETAEFAANLIRRMLQAVRESPLLTIGVAQGAAMAGGAGLLSACDVTVGAEDLQLGYPEVHRGLVAALVMTLLRRQIAERHIRELLLLGDPILAPRAYEMGLLNHVAPAETILHDAIQIGRVGMRGAPGAIARTKRLLDDLWPRSLSEDLERAGAVHVEVRASQESQEGLRAFVERREPSWREVDAGFREPPAK